MAVVVLFYFITSLHNILLIVFLINLIKTKSVIRIMWLKSFCSVAESDSFKCIIKYIYFCFDYITDYFGTEHCLKFIYVTGFILRKILSITIFSFQKKIEIISLNWYHSYFTLLIWIVMYIDKECHTIFSELKHCRE